jgi:hypothetical protein
MTGCRGQKSTTTMTTYHYKDCIVNSITMQYRNIKKLREIFGNSNPYSLPDEEQYDNYTIDKNDWNLILDLLTTAVYDESQWDRENNPDGYHLKILPHDITLVINCSSGAKTEVYVWEKSPNYIIKINEKWYVVNSSKRAEFDSMFSKYTE